MVEKVIRFKWFHSMTDTDSLRKLQNDLNEFTKTENVSEIHNITVEASGVYRNNIEVCISYSTNPDQNQHLSIIVFNIYGDSFSMKKLESMEHLVPPGITWIGANRTDPIVICVPVYQ